MIRLETDFWDKQQAQHSVLTTSDSTTMTQAEARSEAHSRMCLHLLRRKERKEIRRRE